LLLILLLTATNLYSVGSYGEFEFWFAGIKVAAIIIFIVLGVLFVIGLWPGEASVSRTSTPMAASSPTGLWRCSAASPP
jgi:GABA permease